jgi:hypothetical protein
MLSKVAMVVQCALLALNLIVMGLNIASPSWPPWPASARISLKRTRISCARCGDRPEMSGER